MGGTVKKRSMDSRRSFYYNPLKMNHNFNITFKDYLSIFGDYFLFTYDI